MVTLIKALQVILALSILIFIHELGHYFWARIFGIRVDKFYLFFDFGGKKLISWKWGDTEFGIGWFPLGGYCKIAGMIDESMDMDQMKAEPKPWEFRTRPCYQRLLVMAGGVLNNFIFAILAYILIMGIWGEAFLPAKGTKIAASELAAEMGFKTGDEILSLDGSLPESFGMIQADIARRNVRVAQVLRGTDTLDLYLDHSLMSEVLSSPLMFDIALPFVVDSVASEENSGLKRNDRVIAFGEKEIQFLQDARTVLTGFANTTVQATVVRNADTLSIPVCVDSLGRIGVYMKMPETVHKQYKGFEAVPAGFRLTGEIISGYLKDLKMLATPSTGAYKSVGSFIAIGQIFPATWDWYQFMYILALISIMLGIMNLIPIPGLDGGHILFTLYEMVTGRKPSDRFLYIMQILGMIIIAALMILAFGNDIGRLIH